MKKCFKCKYKGAQWRSRNKIPDHHCQHPVVQQEVEDRQDPWWSVQTIFDSCDRFEEKEGK